MYRLFASICTLLLCANAHSSTNTPSSTNASLMTFADPCERETKAKNLLFAVFCGFVLVASIAGNVICIVTISCTRHLRSMSAYWFVVSLAVADIGVSIFVTAMKVDINRHNTSFCYSEEMCVFSTVMDFLFPIASISHLLVIAIDRCIAITQPFFYATHFTKSNVKLIIILLWLCCAVWSSLSLVSWKPPHRLIPIIITVNLGRFCYSPNKYYFTVIFSVVFVIPTVVAFVLYMIILRIAVNQAHAIAKLNPRNKKNSREMKATKVVFLVFTVFTICWLPHTIIVVINYWNPPMINSFKTWRPSAYDAITGLFSTILPTLNSCANPFLYFLAGSHFRTAFRELTRKWLKKPRRDGSEYMVTKFVSNV